VFSVITTVDRKSISLPFIITARDIKGN